MLDSASLQNNKFYTKSIDDTLDNLGVNEDGLTSQEVEARRGKFGYNELREKQGKTIFDLFIEQFQSILVWILIIAAILSTFNNDIKEAILIGIILVVNSVFGVYQEWKADKAIEALKKMTTFECRTIRNGEIHQVESKELVPGDIVILEQGDRVPADGRIIEADNLKVEEAALTGESTDVLKNHKNEHPDDTSLADRKNMVFMGTYITFGKANMVVTATGMDTEMGQIAESVQSIEESATPFQIKVDEFGTSLGYGIIFMSFLIIGIGLLVEDIEPIVMIEIGISLAVAAIPEGLPIIITLVLALGVQTMARQNAIIKKLPVVESLGSTTVIATDKTGTLTRNQMTVTKTVYFEDNGEKIIDEKQELSTPIPDRVQHMYNSAILCNNSKIQDDNKLGDPTEQAVLYEANKKGFDIKKTKTQYQRVKEVPFDSDRKRMSVLVKNNGNFYVYMKGAPDVLLDICGYVDFGNGKVKITEAIKNRLNNKMEELASQALRVLAFAFAEVDSEEVDPKEIESDLVLVGFMGMIDPPKDGVKEAINLCNKAGIRVMMVTGDHKITAKAIGQDIGLVKSNDTVITGRELDQLDDKELSNRVKDIRIFARISPTHKLRITQALKNNNEIVAMTGDGVNDAPAIKGADIGISMGIAGTDVTKETADMILTDDNFASIVNAIEEGRAIFDNMNKFIRYMLSSNFAEILVVFLAIIFTWPVPLVAVQILFINLVTDGLPALAMSAEPHVKDIMNRPPRDTDEPLLSKATSFYIGRIAIYITIASLAMFYWADFDNNLIKAQTLAFSTLAISQLFNSFNSRYRERTILDRSFFDNMILFWVVILSILIQLFTVHGDQFIRLFIPGFGNPINGAFHTVPLEIGEWVIVFLVSIGVIVYNEIFKFFIRKYSIVEKLPDLSMSV